MPDVFDAYKPLRNYLRKVDLINALGAIRWYINYFQLKNPPPPPNDMVVDGIIKDKQKAFTIFLPWQLAVLAREVVINSALIGHTKDFRNPNDFAGGFNKMKAIDNYVGEHFVDQSNIHHIVSKVMSHQQFAWQENWPNHQAWNRYYCIYQHPQLRPIFEARFGMTVEKFFAISMLIWHNYTRFLGLNYPPVLNLERIGGTNDDYDLFLKHYSLTLEELRSKLEDPVERHIDYDFLYYYDSLKRYPIILTEIDGVKTHICPVPTYLYWRTTDGVYYELVGQSGFDQALGEAFKSYIGEVLNLQKYSRRVAILDADAYIKQELPKPDWIFIDREAVAFIECKSKRMTVGAKIEHNFSPITEEQLRKLAESIIQCYKAIIDAQKRGHKDLAQTKDYYPVVVTLEDWYIVGDIDAKLRDEVLKEATKDGIDHAVISAHPYLAISSHELEKLAVVLRTEPLGEVLTPFLTDQQFSGWQFTTYLSKAYTKESSGYKLFDKNFLTEALEKMLGKKLE